MITGLDGTSVVILAFGAGAVVGANLMYRWAIRKAFRQAEAERLEGERRAWVKRRLEAKRSEPPGLGCYAGKRADGSASRPYLAEMADGSARRGPSLPGDEGEAVR